MRPVTTTLSALSTLAAAAVLSDDEHLGIDAVGTDGAVDEGDVAVVVLKGHAQS